MFIRYASDIGRPTIIRSDRQAYTCTHAVAACSLDRPDIEDVDPNESTDVRTAAVWLCRCAVRAPTHRTDGLSATAVNWINDEAVRQASAMQSESVGRRSAGGRTESGTAGWRSENGDPTHWSSTGKTAVMKVTHSTELSEEHPFISLHVLPRFLRLDPVVRVVPVRGSASCDPSLITASGFAACFYPWAASDAVLCRRTEQCPQCHADGPVRHPSWWAVAPPMHDACGRRLISSSSAGRYFARFGRFFAVETIQGCWGERLGDEELTRRLAAIACRGFIRASGRRSAWRLNPSDCTRRRVTSLAHVAT